MTRISERSRSVAHFLVMEILERAQMLESQGRDVVHLEIGEPDFATPHSVVEAGTRAIVAGRTRYTHSLGIAPLREAIAARFWNEYRVDLSPDRVVITIGSSGALLLAFATLLDVGDEVVVPDPGYPCYPNIARTLGAVPVPVHVRPEDRFLYDVEDVRQQIGSRTRALVVSSPANPTGTVASVETLHALAGLEIPVVSDEIYHGLTYRGRAPSALEVDDDAFVVGGFSKLFAMTGWRLGFLVCPASCVRTIQAIQQNLFISPGDFTQHAALAALEAHDDVKSMLGEYDRRRTVMLRMLTEMGLRVPAEPEGAFYVFADASRFSTDSMGLALDILEHAHVAVAPGIDFGARGEGFLRLSYATSVDRIEEGMRRLSRYLDTLEPQGSGDQLR